MRLIVSSAFILFFFSTYSQVVDSISFNDTERLIGKVTCLEVKDKRMYLDSIYMSLRDDAYSLAEQKRIKDAPCYWYGIKLKTEERFEYELCDECICKLGLTSKSYYAYKFKFYIIRYKYLPLTYPFYSGYNYCGDELLSEHPSYLFRE